MGDVEARTVRKINTRFLPILFISFIVCFLDRVNVGFATLTMSKDLGFSGTVFGLGAGLFFIGYFLFEVPSNMALERFGARLWMFRIMVTWGILSAATAFVWNDWSFYTVRFLLGLAEAGYFPGIAFYFTLWLPSRHRGRVNSIFLAAMPFASVIGGPVSGYLLTLDGLFGLHGWQLLYLVEGLPSVFLAFFLLAWLRDVPERAEWLEPAERDWLLGELHREREQAVVLVRPGLAAIFTSPVILLLSVVYFGIVCFNFALSFFVPTIVHDFGLSFVQTGFVSAIPFLIGGVGMILWGRHSDRHEERRAHVLTSLSLAAIGLGGATLIGDPTIKLILLCVASLGVFSTVPVFWVLMPSMLAPASVAVAFAVVNSVGNLSGFSAPFFVGWLKDVTGTVNAGLQVVVLFGIVAIAILAMIIRYQHRVATTGHAMAAE
jgi:MFS family permease